MTNTIMDNNLIIKQRAAAAKETVSTDQKSTNPSLLNQYRKHADGKYWFEMIPKKDRKNWHDMVSNSIPQYFNDIVNSGGSSDTITNEYKEYIAAANKFLDGN